MRLACWYLGDKDAPEKRNELFVVTRDVTEFGDAIGKIRSLSIAAPKLRDKKTLLHARMRTRVSESWGATTVPRRGRVLVNLRVSRECEKRLARALLGKGVC